MNVVKYLAKYFQRVLRDATQIKKKSTILINLKYFANILRNSFQLTEYYNFRNILKICVKEIPSFALHFLKINTLKSVRTHNYQNNNINNMFVNIQIKLLNIFLKKSFFCRNSVATYRKNKN